MPARSRPARTPPVVFDEAAWAEDMLRASAAARAVAEHARGSFEESGVAIDQLKACAAEGSDGTELPHCVKVPAGAGWSAWHGLRDQPRREPAPPAVRGVRHTAPVPRNAAAVGVPGGPPTAAFQRRGLTGYGFRISLNSATILERRIERRRVSASSLTYTARVTFASRWPRRNAISSTLAGEESAARDGVPEAVHRGHLAVSDRDRTPRLVDLV
jgi:hypothetical protein